MKLADCVHDIQPGPHGTLGIVLVCLRVAEIGEDTVAQIFGHMAVVAANDCRRRLLVGTHNLPHILRVEPTRECGGVDKVAEHHR